MKKILLPLILLIAGIGAGGTAAKVLGSKQETDTSESAAQCEAESEVVKQAELPNESAKAFARLSNQFVVPVVEDGHVKSMVVLSLSAEVEEAKRDAVYEYEPKLRDRFLQDLFNHANAGGFDGTFTDAATLKGLRDILLSTAQSVFGPAISDILIIDISRQDM
ncbi:flagellar basal body-associated protein FliL [Pelagovum sp. HNIBRBA483]|uniref:flagellar basal body-associated protein FliL n=1 Tax=Pelagovum sp. HNIBRBA483 TaxID=3233341 RepID=UPI0034A24289